MIFVIRHGAKECKEGFSFKFSKLAKFRTTMLPVWNIAPGINIISKYG